MSFTLRELPRDGDGIIIGMWRVRHKSSAFEGGLGGAVPVSFVKGVADRPMGGGDLHKLMCAMGDELTCDPWEGDVPKPAQDTTRRSLGLRRVQKGDESLMSPQERSELKADRARQTALDAAAKTEEKAKYSGLPPHVPFEARAEMERRDQHVASPDERRPKITPDTEPVEKATPVAEAPAVVEAPAMDDNQRAVLDMLEDAGDDVDALRDLAGEVGIKVDRRWRSERLRVEIKSAAQSAETIVPPSDSPDELDSIEDLDILRSIAEGQGIEDADRFDSAASLRVEIRRVRADAARV